MHKNLGKDQRLKPCPCCSSIAELWSKDHCFSVKCTKCGIKTCQLASKSQARKTWNRRKYAEELKKKLSQTTARLTRHGKKHREY